MPYIPKETIFEHTDGGLSIFKTYFPQADTKKKFKLREKEKTASANLKKTPDGVWVLTDFGGDSKPRNAIQMVMEEDGLKFNDALNHIAQKFNIPVESASVEAFKPVFSKSKATKKQEEGKYYWEKRESMTEAELATLGKHVKEEVCYHYNLVSLEAYTFIKKGEALRFEATDNYPIFLFDFGDWQKLYRPNELDKSYRFMYINGRPQDFIFGLSQAKTKVAELRKNANEDEDPEDIKLEEIFICSGDRDALNVASIGYPVLWMNSETATISDYQWKKEITPLAHKVYNIPDIDLTGRIQGNKLAVKFLDMYTLWLPDELADRRDFRGNSCKDVTDFFKYYRPFDFKRLVDTAACCKFWNKIIKSDKEGGIIGVEFKFNNVRAYEFLKANGFYRYESPNEKDGYFFIQITGNIVSKTEARNIKGFVNRFLIDRQCNEALRNMIYKTSQLKPASLENLPTKEIDFTDFEKKSQILFFKNKTWKIGPDGIDEYKPGQLPNFVWEEEVIDVRVRKLSDFFEITFDKDNDCYEIDVKDDSFSFFKYLINTSRVHWQKEVEQKIELDKDEEWEQRQHLINKIYSIGYLLHRYKDPSRPWMAYAMDNRESDVGESHGGSGKSILFQSIRKFMSSFSFNGRNRRLTDNQHLMGVVTENTDYIIVDDAHQYFDMDFFFSFLTGPMDVNPKNAAGYEIPFDKSPKFAVTTNHSPKGLDGSQARRLLFSVFSDYYHNNETGDYERDWSPRDEFGKNLFSDYNDDEWNMYCNFIAQCISFYLRCDRKIGPPMAQVRRRQLRMQMGDTYKEWADVYFSTEGSFVDCEVSRIGAYEHFKDSTKNRTFSAIRFKKATEAFCIYNGYTLNPKELINDIDNGRIIRRKESDGSTEEKFYIQTKPEINMAGLTNDEDGRPPVSPAGGDLPF